MSILSKNLKRRLDSKKRAAVPVLSGHDGERGVRCSPGDDFKLGVKRNDIEIEQRNNSEVKIGTFATKNG